MLLSIADAGRSTWVDSSNNTAAKEATVSFRGTALAYAGDVRKWGMRINNPMPGSLSIS